jgi:ligand-binding sensor domain-containing protein
MALLAILINSCKKESDAPTYSIYTDGLISTSVLSVVIDKDGNKWIGTQGGVSKFDNVNWTTYNTTSGLAGNNVMAIAIDIKGKKWFGTEGGGVSKFDGTNWTTYNTSNGLAGNNYK